MSSLVTNYCQTLTYDELGFPFCKTNPNEVVDDLFAVIQHIVAGTAVVSKKMITETCLEWKIQLNPNSPVILLQYEWKGKKSGMTHLIPVIDFKQVDEKSRREEDVNIVHESIISFDDVKENSTLLFNLKQGTPELLSVQNNNEEINYKQSFSSNNIQQNPTEHIPSEIDMYSKSISDSIQNSEKRILSTVERELMADDSTMTILQPEEEIRNSANKTLDERSNSERSKIDVYSGGNRFTCEDWGKYFSKSNTLPDHKKIHTSEKTFKCGVCNKSFTTLSSLKRHQRIHTGEKLFKCDECGKSFPTSFQITQHMRTHTGEKPFKCELCKKPFSMIGNLLAHIRIHTAEKPFKCGECGKSFTQSSNLTQHMRTHMSEKPFNCGVCNKSFTTLSSLKRHQRIHTGEKLFKCGECGKSFPTSFQITQHMRTHTGDKPFKCELCKKPFATTGNLLAHTRIHTGEKPFNCSACGKSFTQRSNLTQHMRTHR